MRKPYFRKQNRNWYVKIDGKDVRLGPDKVEAFKLYHELMAGKEREAPEPSSPTVNEIIAQFLEWSATHQAASSTKLYRFFCDSFTAKHGNLKLTDLKPVHVARWLDARGFHGNGGNCAVRSIVRPFNWAAKMGLIKENPIQGADRPAATPRECYLTQEQYKELIKAIPDEEFRNFVSILRETGCRPQEACAVEARHFDPEGRVWTFPREESKGKKLQRVVVLNDRAFNICLKLAAKHPSGPLFRNRAGNRWCADSLNCRFRRLSEKLGFKVFSYVLRHAWITDALLRGVEPLTVATLAGHVSINMIWSVYNKLRLQSDHMRMAVKLATGES